MGNLNYAAGARGAPAFQSSRSHDCSVRTPGELPGPANDELVECRSLRIENLQRFLVIQSRIPYYSYPYIHILLELAKSCRANSRVSVSGFGLETDVPATTALRALSELEKAGLVLRSQDSADRRRSYVTATDKGLRVVAAFMKNLASLIPDVA